MQTKGHIHEEITAAHNELYARREHYSRKRHTHGGGHTHGKTMRRTEGHIHVGDINGEAIPTEGEFT